MSEEPKICPKCGSKLTGLKGDLRYCAKCGFEGEEKKRLLMRSSAGSHFLFWLALLAPAALGLFVATRGKALNSYAFETLVVSFLIGPFAGFYCSHWLMSRFSKKNGQKPLLLMVLLGIALTLVNFMILFVGCASNIRF